MFRFLKSVLFFFLIGFVACSSGSSSSSQSDTTAPLMVITNSTLRQNSSHLSGTLSVYSEGSTTPVTETNLLFAEDENGDLTVSSPSVKLKKSTVYRFVIIFYWDDIPFAYVDTTQATGADSATQLSYSESLIVYNVSLNNPDVSASISDGVLPNLDSDGDGYSNFEELRAGTDTNDDESTPDGPAIIWNDLSAGKSVSGTIEINIEAIDKKDGISSLNLTNPSNVNDLSTSLPDKFVGNWNTLSVGDGDFTLIAVATDSKGNTTESHLIVNISNKADHSGPEISFKVFQLVNGESVEVDFNNGETVHDVIQVEAYATDATAVAGLDLSPTVDRTPIDFIQTPTIISNKFKYDTTLIKEGDLNILFESSDIKGQWTTKNLNVKVKNIPSILNFKINNQAITEPLTLSALHDIHISWNGSFWDRVALQKGGECNKDSTELLINRTELDYDRFFTLTSQFGSGNYIFCAYRTGKGLSDNPVPFDSGISVTINWDDDEDGFKNEDDCGPLNNRAFPGNTQAYLMDDNYNCDGDNENIDLGDATYSISGTNNDEEAGYSISYAGDINGDNCNDILVATKGTSTRKPLIYLIYGFGENCIGHSSPDDIDFNLQSIGPDFLGAVFIAEQNDDGAGTSIQGAGDIDGDGCDDFLIGAPFYNLPNKADVGRVYLIYGKGVGCGSTEYSSSNNLASVEGSIRGKIFTGNNTGDNVGASVAGLGNVNGTELDGTKKLDFAFGAPGFDTTLPIPFANAGAVYISTNPLSIVYGGINDEKFGSSLSYGGKFNQDGYDDIIVGSPGYILEGKVSIVPGGTTFTYATMSPFDYSVGHGPNANFPSSLSYMGDTNQDGFDDVMGGDVTGSMDGNQHVGGIQFILGKQDSRIGTMDSISAGPLYPTTLISDQFGKSVASGADINPGLNSNLFDLMIGSPGFSGKGSVSLWLLKNRSFIGITDNEFDDIVTTRNLLGENPGDNAGEQVSLYGGIQFDDPTKTSTSPTPGDFNGDGCADPIIGAPNYGDNNQGKVYVMLSGYCPQ